LTTQVLYPIGAVAGAGEHVEGAAVDGEPHLYLVWSTGHSTGGRQVAKFFFREV
jgi:hypothetical protein